MKFKVGDIVTGKNSDHYIVTTNKAIMEVVKIEGADWMDVKIIQHEELPARQGEIYDVRQKFFKLVEPAKESQKIIIYTKGNDVIAKNLITNKEAIARCHPDDEFDFMVGTKLAIERLEKLELYYVKIADNCSSYLKLDKNNKSVFIGDPLEFGRFKTKFTLEEIEAINPNYLPFAVRVE